MKTISTLLFSLLLLLPVTSPAQVVRVDWQEAFNGQLTGKLTRDPERRIAIVSQRADTLLLVDKVSTPPSPFAGGGAALLVDSTPENALWFRLCFRPFDGPEVPQGVAEFHLHPVEGSAELQVGHQETSWDPAVIETYYVGSLAFVVSLDPGAEPMVAGQAVETDSISTVVAGESYRLTVKWDFAETKPIVRIFLNGEVVRARGATAPMNPPLGVVANKNGLNTFRISLGGPENHLGRLFVGPMAADARTTPEVEEAGDSLLAP